MEFALLESTSSTFVSRFSGRKIWASLTPFERSWGGSSANAPSVFGTKKELKEQKILQSGDVLKSGSFNKDYFTKIDIRQTKEIKLYSKSAKVLTTHPSSSYSLVKDSKEQFVLKISDPAQFWSVSKYLVIQVK